MRIMTLFEDYSEYRQSRWVHYTNHEMMTIRTKTFHSDPSGIYFFPESHKPDSPMWHIMKYKFIVTLKPDARVLDLPKISDDELESMLVAMHGWNIFQAELKQYPERDKAKRVKRAWEILRSQPAIHGGSSANWNKIVRSLGYDAIFDDAGIIHFAEPIQLLVLNPRILTIVTREQPKRHYFQIMTNIVAELKEMCQPFGEVTIEGPKLLRVGWSSPNVLATRLNVKQSEENYADFTVAREDSKGFEHIIRVSLSWSRPKLNYGVGAQFDCAKNEWSFRGLAGIQKDLQKIFSGTQE